MGKLIVFEGTDGTGKSTQYARACKRLEAQGVRFQNIKFPQYDEPSSALIKMYLAGEFGKDPDAINPYAASTFYAVDRYAGFARGWKAFYDEGGVIVCDRYTTSNASSKARRRRNFLPGSTIWSMIKWGFRSRIWFCASICRPSLRICCAKSATRRA